MFHKSTHRGQRRSKEFFAGDNIFSLKVGSWALFLTDALIAAVLLMFPFVMGGREAWGHRILISLALLLAMCWSLHRLKQGGRFLLTSLEPLLIAGLLLVWFQSIPQPSTVLNQASSEYEGLLPLWGETQLTATSGTAETSEPTWNFLSLMPVETRHGFWMLLAYGLIGSVVAQRIQSVHDCHRILRLVAISGALMAGFAVLQLATSNDRYFWFYRHPFSGTRDVLKGTFTNRNHFAQFLALSVGPLIWWALSERRKSQERQRSSIRQGLGPAQGNHSNFDHVVNVRLVLLLCAIAGVLMCAVLSLSRGGMAAAVLAACIACVGLLRNVQARKSLALAVPAIGFVLAAGLLLLGGESVDMRVNQIASGDVNKLDAQNARRSIWKADLEATRHFPFFGTGVGSHREIYPIYMTEFADFVGYEFTHAESSWIHLLLETGLAGLSLLALGWIAILGRLVWRLIRPVDGLQVEAVAAITGGLLAGVMHATADFIWYSPAIVVTTITLAIIGLRLCSGFEGERGLTLPRVFWLGTAVACGVTFLVVQPGLAQRVSGEKYWHQYLIATLDERRDVADAAARMELSGEDGSLESDDPLDTVNEFNGVEVAAQDYRTADQPGADKQKSLYRRMNLLMLSLKAFPDQPRVQLTLATVCLQLFDEIQRDPASDNPMGLTQIRDTVRSSGFESRAQLHEWLNRAFGKSIRLPMLADRMARRSLACCPVQGNAYLSLAETDFLNNPQQDGAQKLIDQALLVRGYDPRVRFNAGQEQLFAGDQAAAIEQWASVFHANAQYRRAITSVFSKMVPPAFVMQQFSPELSELGDVIAVYRTSSRAHDLRPVLDAIQQQIDHPSVEMTDDAKVRLLMEACDAARQIQLLDQCEVFLTKAIAIDEHAYHPRRALGMLHLERQNYSEAAKVLLWCYEQQPGDAQIVRLIRDARKKAMQSETSVLSTSFSADAPPIRTTASSATNPANSNPPFRATQISQPQ